ncbi:MAG: aminotransferase class III-fold pyridoxal phosphate-dependent enzyme, partial [Polyangiales bacterium]
WAGAGRRYGGAVPEAVARQLREELQLIEELGYGGYFLTMHTIVNFCHEQHILCQGRGSAANSVVCYCLGITAIDPVRMQLLFARFLSRERAEPPDIDLDIEHGRREEVIRFVYARYGTRHAAMVANVVRYRRRSALRDVGKVLGLPPADIDALAGRGHPQDAAPQPLDVRHTTLDADAPSVRQLATLSAMLVGTPRHLSIHPGGFLLGREPVDALVPIEDARRPGRTVIQWDKDDIEALGFFKVDLLALGALTAIHHAFDMLETHCGKTLSMDQIPAQDPATYAMLQQADTVGVFQIESRAQMSMLPRLRPATFYDLVVQVAIVRPGPIQGDMVHPYLRRRAGEEEASYPHPALETTLRRTLGVPIFQEQVMKIAILVAGYSPGEADQLRRDMAAWRTPGRIEAHRERLIGGMQARGIAPAFVEAVFRQILGFGEYGFPESHAASFALIAYATAWLKCHHPAIFLCAMLQAQPMGFYSVSTLVRDAQRHGVVVRPVDVRHSRWRSSLEPLPDGRLGVRMGLRQVKGLGERAAERLIAAAAHCGDLHHLQRQVGLALPQALALARAGAFASFGLSRRAALWQLRALHSEAEPLLEQTRLGEDADKHSAHAGRATHHIGSADVMQAWGDPEGEAIHTGTFTGNPLGCASSLAALEVLQQAQLCKRASTIGAHLLSNIRKSCENIDCVLDVRGRGMLLGIQ